MGISIRKAIDDRLRLADRVWLEKLQKYQTSGRNVMRFIAPMVDPAIISDLVKSSIKTFIIKVANNENSVRWPGYKCTLWVGGRPVEVIQGNQWATSEQSLYVYHTSLTPAPSWVPGFLAAVARFYGIGGDEEVKAALMDMCAKMVADIYQPLFQTFGAQTLTGAPVHRLAVNTVTKVMAGRVVSTIPGENGAEPTTTAEWQTMTGEAVEVDEDDESWIQMEMEED